MKTHAEYDDRGRTNKLSNNIIIICLEERNHSLFSSQQRACPVVKHNQDAVSQKFLKDLRYLV